MKASSVEVGKWYFTRLGTDRPIQLLEKSGQGFYYKVYGKSSKSPLYLSDSEIEAAITRQATDREMEIVHTVF
jgi:hypothetical protein